MYTGSADTSQVDLINVAMKLNSSLTGKPSDQSLAHQFYYHIPDPILPYMETNLKNFDDEQYKEMEQNKYDINMFHNSNLKYSQPAPQPQPAPAPATAYPGAPVYDYASGQYVYPQAQPQAYPYPAHGQQYPGYQQQYAQPGYNYNQYYQDYYAQYYAQQQQQQQVAQVTPSVQDETTRITQTFYEDVNLEQVESDTLDQKDIKDMNQTQMDNSNENDLILF